MDHIPSFKRLMSRKGLNNFTPLTGRTGWGLPARILKFTIDTAFMATVGMAILFSIATVISIFLPLDSFSIAIEDGANTRQMPLTRTLVLFVMAVVTTYFAGIVLILYKMRRLFSTLLAGDPFQPDNIMRLRMTGTALAFVTLLGWGARWLIAERLAVGAIDAPSIGELITPAFSVLVIFSLAELFREGARVRRESELTI